MDDQGIRKRMYDRLQRCSRCRSWAAILFFALLFGATSHFAAAAGFDRDGEKVIVLYHLHHSLPSSYWSEVMHELKKELPEDFLARTSWVQMTPKDGFSYEGHADILDVSFTGRCDLVEQDTKASRGPLGWVLMVDGEIQPFIHVSCERIAESVGALLVSQPRIVKQQLLARATARVVAHEILHVLNQSAAHTRGGVQKPALAPDELLENSLR